MEQPIASSAPLLGSFLPCDAGCIESALAQQASLPAHVPHKRLGELLLETGLISPQDLRKALEAQRVARLRNCSLFAGFSGEELITLSGACEEVTVEAGEVFITEGHKESCLYILASGELEVFRTDKENAETLLATVPAGEAVGEMGYLYGGVRTASVRASVRCQLLRIPYCELVQLTETIPPLAHGFLALVTRRLFSTNLLYQEQHHRVRYVERYLSQLSDYLDLSAMVELGADIEALIERLVHTVSSLMDADRASLFLLDTDSGELWSHVAEGAEIREIRLPAGQGIAGWAVQHKEMVNIHDAYSDDRFHREVDRDTGYRTHTILCAPILNLSNEVIGVVQVINKRHGHFHALDEVMIRAFASQAALAVENFNLYNKVLSNHRKMAMLLDVTTSINDTLDLKRLVRQIVGRTSQALQCERSSFFVVDEETRELWSMEAHGSELQEIRFPMSMGLAGYAASTGEVVKVRDAYEDDRFNREFDRLTGYRTQSVLCVPVVNRDGKITGVTECINKRHGAFDDDDVHLLRAIASQISVALDNAQLHTRTVDMRNYLESIQQSVSNGILTLDESYRVVMTNRVTDTLFRGMALGGPERHIRRILGEANAEICHMIDAGYDRRTPVTRDGVNLQRSAGDVSTVNVSVLPLKDGEDTFKGLVLVIEDVTSEKRIKSAFSHYLAPTVIDQLLAHPETLALGGEKREVTALFTDIEGFTSLAESVGPDALVHLLNEYFDQVCNIVLQYGGTIDKIVGDSLHVLFNAPIDQMDHATRAVKCALEIDTCCRALIVRHAERGIAFGQTRIGINTGFAVVGNFGGTARFDYTAHGDAVNTAARLEGANKYLGTRICVSAMTKAGCPDVAFRPIGQLLLKGKSKATEVYEPVVSLAVSKAPMVAYLEAYELMARGDCKAPEAFAALARRHPADGLINFHAHRLGGGATGITLLLPDK